MKKGPWSKAEKAKLIELAASTTDAKTFADEFFSAGYDRTPQALYSYMNYLGIRSKYPELRLSLHRLINKPKKSIRKIALKPFKINSSHYVARVRHLIKSVEYGDMTKSQAFDAIRKLVE